MKMLTIVCGLVLVMLFVMLSTGNMISKSGGSTHAQQDGRIKPNGVIIQPAGTLQVIKFYDANANGTLDLGDSSIVGWRVTIQDGVSHIRSTPVSESLPPDTYTEGAI